MERNLVITSTESYSFSENSSIKIDWNINNNLRELVFKENSIVDLLEIDCPKCDLVYVVERNSTLHLSISSLNSALNSNRKFILNENSSVIVACADFTVGTKKEEFSFDLQKEGASVKIHLATLSAENDKKEFSVSFIHNAKNTYAEMNNYGVCIENSKLIFSGIGYIRKGAKNAKTHQNAKIMVFDPSCQAFANPILKIDENEIEASHAAAVGRVNDNHLFYLTSRGLKEDVAKQLITLGYLKPILAYFDEDMSASISSCMERRMK